MGYRPIRTCSDAAGHGFYLEVTCPQCRRVAIFNPAEFFVTKWFTRPVEQLAARMVCQGGPSSTSGCGWRGVSTRFITYPPTPPSRAIPKPVATPAPKGIDQTAWDAADERERRRLIRIARG